MSHYSVPLLVQVVGGNPATLVAVLQCLNTRDVTILRQLHPVLLRAVTDVPWCDMVTAIHDVRRWRAALPAAVGARLTPRLRSLDDPVLLVGLTSLNAQNCNAITDAVVQRLPLTLRHLNVSECRNLTRAASFTHLTVLMSFNGSITAALDAGLEALPPSLQALRMDACVLELEPGARFHCLPALCVLLWRMGNASATSIETLPPTLEVLDVSYSPNVEAVSLAHLPRLSVFRGVLTSVTNATVATLPATLVELNLGRVDKLTPAVSFAHLRALRTLDLRDTGIGVDVPIRPESMPPSLVPRLGTSDYSCVIA